MHFIKADPADIYTQKINKPLHSIGATGINGTLYDRNGSVMILINRGQIIGRNAIYNGWNSPARPVIYYTNSGDLKCELVQNTNQLSVPIKDIRWAVGGGSLIPTRLIAEKWGSDVTRAGARRTGLAIKDGYIYLIVSATGISLNTFSDRINAVLGNVTAVFLDGGGSTQMVYDGRSVVGSSRAVDNGIFVIDK